MSEEQQAAEEQAMEWEALQAIYPNGEITDLTPTSDKERGKILSFSIHIKLEADDLSGLSNDTVVAVVLTVTYPPAYPFVIPGLQVKTDSPHTVGNSHCNKIMECLMSQAPSFLGMAMIYSLAALTKDWLVDNILPDLRAKAGQVLQLPSSSQPTFTTTEEDLGISTAVSNQRRYGTPVTEETFSQWKKQFLEEVHRGNEGKAVVANKQGGALTGRQLFEHNALEMIRSDGVGGADEVDHVAAERDRSQGSGLMVVVGDEDLFVDDVENIEFSDDDDDDDDDDYDDG